MHLRSSYDAGVQRLFSLASKKALLESEKSQSTLAESAEYADLKTELDDLRADLDETVRELGERDEFVSVYRDLERDLGDGADVPVLTDDPDDAAESDDSNDAAESDDDTST
jgi:hypothetical protein